MIRRLGFFGFAVALTGAIVAASASAAHAVPEFKAASYPATLTAEQVGAHELIGNIGTTTCKKVTGHGTLAAASSALVLEPAYDECTTENGFVGVTVKVNGCKYQFRLEDLHPGDKDLATGKVDFLCPPGKVVELVMGTACTVKIGSQEDVRFVFYKDITAAKPEHLEISMSTGEISYTQSGMFCSGSFNDGSLVGGLTVKADDSDTNPTGLKFE
ncbi:MAG TPA: hypothetical protein VFY04_00570 [Solirubrobacterales bacterium]|nr:hypothetical protein [Solirubrobacterales bacterium]